MRSKDCGTSDIVQSYQKWPVLKFKRSLYSWKYIFVISFAIQNLITSDSFRKSFTLWIFIHVEFRTIKVWIDILQSRNSCRPEVDFFTVLNLSNEACPFIMPLRSFSLTLFKLTAFCQKIESVQTNDDCANLPKQERIEY